MSGLHGKMKLTLLQQYMASSAGLQNSHPGPSPSGKDRFLTLILLYFKVAKISIGFDPDEAPKTWVRPSSLRRILRFSVISAPCKKYQIRRRSHLQNYEDKNHIIHNICLLASLPAHLWPHTSHSPQSKVVCNHADRASVKGEMI